MKNSKSFFLNYLYTSIRHHMHRLVGPFFITSYGITWIIVGISCESSDFSETVINNDTLNCGPSISIDLDSGNFVEEMEEIYFNSKDWEEEDLNVDLL